MREIKLKIAKKIDGKKGLSIVDESLFAPSNAGEITLREYVDFQICMRDKAPEKLVELSKINDQNEWAESLAAWGSLDWNNYYIFLGNVLSVFIKTKTKNGKFQKADILTILNLKKGQAFIDETSGDNLCALYRYIVKTINEYQPKELGHFEYKKMLFKVPDRLLDDYGRTMYAPEIKTIEAIEALQIEHVFSEKNKEGDYIYPDRLYHTDIGVMAAICRKSKKEETEEGETKIIPIETLPLNMTARQKFLQKRMKFFNDVPMTVALDIDFFLSNSKRISILTQARERHLRILTTTFALQRSQKKSINFGVGSRY